MKRFLKALVLLSVCVFTMTGLSSCKKDNNSSTFTNIVGEWKTLSMTVAGVEESSDKPLMTKYDADGTYWSIYTEGAEYEQEGTWTLSNGVLTMTIQDDEGPQSLALNITEIKEGQIELKSGLLTIILERVK